MARIVKSLNKICIIPRLLLQLIKSRTSFFEGSFEFFSVESTECLKIVKVFRQVLEKEMVFETPCKLLCESHLEDLFLYGNEHLDRTRINSDFTDFFLQSCHLSVVTSLNIYGKPDSKEHFIICSFVLISTFLCRCVGESKAKLEDFSPNGVRDLKQIWEKWHHSAEEEEDCSRKSSKQTETKIHSAKMSSLIEAMFSQDFSKARRRKSRRSRTKTSKMAFSSLNIHSVILVSSCESRKIIDWKPKPCFCFSFL